MNTRPPLDALAALVAAGVPLDEALDTVGGGRYERVRVAMTAGKTFADAASGGLCPPEGVPFLRHGAKHGALEEGLRIAARKLPRGAARVRYLAWTAKLGGLVDGFANGAELFPNAPWSRIAELVRGGSALGAAVAGAPDALAPSIGAALAKSEEAGILPEFLAALADHLEAGRLADTRIRNLADAAAALSLHLRAGRTVAEAAPAIAAGGGGELSKAVAELAGDPATGPSLSERMAKHKNVYDAVSVRLVRAGEAAGSLDRTFAALAELETLGAQRQAAEAAGRTS